MKKLTRRDGFRWLGVSLSLPLLEATLGLREANAATPSKKRFIGCFFPSGAAMDAGDHGDWTLNGALSSLRTKAVDTNVVIARGFRAVKHHDVHWTGTAAFLSCNEVGLYTIPTGVRAGERCGKSFDQYVADLESTKIRSLHAGTSYVSSWDESHDSQLSIQYVNSVAWRDDRTPIRNTMNPQELFTRVFGDGSTASAAQIRYLLQRRKSILDGVHAQLSTFRKTITASDRAKMDAYEGGIRDVETELSAKITETGGATTCASTGVQVTDPNAYLAEVKTMQKIIVRAFQCNATRAATLMYSDGIGERVGAPLPRKQHDCAHNDWEKVKLVNRAQMDAWSDLVKDLKDTGLLAETIVVCGSNMSDGRSHSAANAPFIVASQGPELKLGQEIIGTTDHKTESSNRVIADIYMDLFPLFGITKPSFGEGKDRSTGRPSGLRT